MAHEQMQLQPHSVPHQHNVVQHQEQLLASVFATPPYLNYGNDPLPPMTMRTDLVGRAVFMPFPEDVYYKGQLRHGAPPRQFRPADLAGLFFGQLPFRLTDMMVIYLFGVLANADVLYIERIVQDNSKKGCMQVYVHEADVERIIAAFHKRVLFDNTGVWLAYDPYQRAALQQHGDNPQNRFKGLPFYPMVVERSKSSYERQTCSCEQCALAQQSQSPSDPAHNGATSKRRLSSPVPIV